MFTSVDCPVCHSPVHLYKNPVPTVDIIIYTADDTLLFIKRKNKPLGWALPGGFVDYGESVENAAMREAEEETGLRVTLTHLVGVYSDPSRDARQHTISITFAAPFPCGQTPHAGDDAGDFAFFPFNALPPLVFDHARIVSDFLQWRNNSK